MEIIDYQDIDAYIETTWEDLVRDIAQLVHIPSVGSEPAGPQAPFGVEVRRALDCGLEIARRLGYAIDDHKGYMGIADIAGESATQIGMIAHLDVVPAGPGWNTNPWELQRREGWLLGRGVMDDKGPAVLALYAGAYILQRGISPHYSLRVLLGCDEESGMSDVHEYLNHHEGPAFLFTPDASFPVCNAEKGCFGVTLVSGVIDEGCILMWRGAEATNAVPGESICELAVDISELPQPVDERIQLSAVNTGRTRIVAKGIGGHASTPQDCVNAIALVVRYLLEAEVLSGSEQAFVALLGRVLADSNGVSAGIDAISETFGALTCNGGTIEVGHDHCIRQTLDIRYPDTTSGEHLQSLLVALATEYGATCEVTRNKPPFSVAEDHPAVQALLQTYHDVTGQPAAPFSMGGGTYARNFSCAVSFGPERSDEILPSWAGSIHGPHEAAREDQLKEALKIYIISLLRLMDLELEQDAL